MKKILIIALVFASTLPIAVFAQSDANCTEGFCSLTNIQNVKFAGNAAELPAFLNAIYMICIGLAAVIGVLQIMRAGVTWMTAGGSHERIGDAKKLIRDTIVGLVLVLAPTIVFSIINPDILSLQIRGLKDLYVNDKPDPAIQAGDILWTDTESSFMTSNARCAQEGGLPVPHCRPTDNRPAYVAKSGETCDGTLFTVCMRRDSSTGDQSSSDTSSSLIGKVVADFKGGATAPPSVIPNTIGKTWTPNTACKQIQDGEVISRTGSQETCCSYQQSASVSCTVQARSYKDLSSASYCTCTTK